MRVASEEDARQKTWSRAPCTSTGSIRKQVLSYQSNLPFYKAPLKSYRSEGTYIPDLFRRPYWRQRGK